MGSGRCDAPRLGLSIIAQAFECFQAHVAALYVRVFVSGVRGGTRVGC
jgi:hypothetical protein